MFALFMGLVGAAITGWDLSLNAYGWAAFAALISAYWFTCAALDRLFDKVAERLVVFGPMPIEKDNDNAL